MFESLLKSGQIGKITVKNRMKYAATIDNFCNKETGEVTDREIAYLAERAKGGAGMVTSQGGYIHLLGKGYPAQMGVDNDNLIPGLRRLARAIQSEGAIAIGQVLHTGRYAHPHEEGQQPLGPSAMSSPIKRYAPCREMTIDEVEEQIRLHAQSARRIKEAGFDGVEICGAMGYLISSFLCKLTNKRTDKYGGTLENRARFFLEIIEKVRKEVGSDYPILIRMNAIDLMEGGNTEEEYVEIGKMCEAVTADFISLTIGWHESTLPAMTSEIKAGNWLYLAKKWKDAEIKVPLGISYRLNKPEVADKAMADGIIDYWEMCRPMIADPYIPKKVAEGRPEDIVICPACNMGCFTRVFSGATMSCMLNPRVGKEWDEAYQIKPVERKKKILVVGGGPAGMESARVAALKGHKVTLCERGGKLGGQMRLASKTPMLDDWNDIIRYYSTQLAKAGVDVRLGKQITADLINEENPDVLILATGAKSVVPEIAGTERENVATVFDALEGKVAVGNKVAILGGYEIGVQTAELLASQGKDVTIVEEGKRIGRDINIFNLLSHRRKLTELKVKMLANAKIKMITDAGVVIENSKSGKEETIAADTIVATAVEANKELLDALGFTTEVEEIYSIGDCVAPRKGYNAIHDGFRVGIKV